MLRDIFNSFVKMVLSKTEKEWKSIKKDDLTTDDLELFKKFVAVSFDFKEIVYGKLEGHYRDVGEDYVVNKTCPVMVVGETDDDSKYATNWLEKLFYRIVNCRNLDKDDWRLGTVYRDFEGSVPLKPLQLTMHGELLVESSYGHLFRRSKETDECSGLDIGTHKYCNGVIDRRRTAEKWDVLLCRACNLRVLIPHNIKTYKDLRIFIEADCAKKLRASYRHEHYW